VKTYGTNNANRDLHFSLTTEMKTRAYENFQALTNQKCSSGITDAWFVRGRGVDGIGSPADAAWTNSIHGFRGNILTLDGAVQITMTKELDALIDIGDDNGSLHFLVPN